MGRSTTRRAARVRGDTELHVHAQQLLGVPISGLAREFQGTLETVARRLGADRATLWEHRPAERQLRIVQQWARDGYAHAVKALSADDFPWLFEQLLAGRRVAYRSVSAIPIEALRERKLITRHGPTSGVMLPLIVGEATAAVLVVGNMHRERGWGRTTLAYVERAGLVLAGALVRQRAHEAWLGTEGRLAGVLEAGPVGILLVRPGGRIELGNGAAASLFLRTQGELAGARLQDLLLPTRDAGAVPGRSVVDVLLASDEPLQLSARRSDGTGLPVEVTIRELRAPGDPLFCCGLRDVSEERRAREEAARLRDELAFMGRTAMVAEMGAGIAHELNQPLTAILSNAESAQRLLGAEVGPALDEVRAALTDVVADALRAAEVLSRIRDMLRRRTVERTAVDVTTVLGNVARRFQEEAVARGIRLDIEVAHGLPLVLGDRVQLEQVAMNLVLNAFEAMPSGKGPDRLVTVRARASRAGGVDVSVRDTGPGLDDEAMAHAFDPFFTTKATGLGMGLAICRSIVESHGGRLLAGNNPEGGAAFEFHLPPAPRREAAAIQREHA